MDIHKFDLPIPHPGQKKVLRDPARIKVLVAGRRWGKNTLGLMTAVEEAAAGHDVVWIAPYQKMMESASRQLFGLVGNQHNVMMTHRAVDTFWFRDAGRIRIMTMRQFMFLSNEDARMDYAILDEAAYMDEETWNKAYALLGDEGKALLMGTPRPTTQNDPDWFRRIYYYSRYAKGWAGWQMNSGINPYVDMAELGRMSVTVSPIAFASEILAQFVVLEPAPEKPPVSREDYFKRFV